MTSEYMDMEMDKSYESKNGTGTKKEMLLKHSTTASLPTKDCICENIF